MDDKMRGTRDRADTALARLTNTRAALMTDLVEMCQHNDTTIEKVLGAVRDIHALDHVIGKLSTFINVVDRVHGLGQACP